MSEVSAIAIVERLLADGLVGYWLRAALLFASGFGVVVLVRHKAPALRHLVWMSTIAAVGALPLTMATLPARFAFPLPGISGRTVPHAMPLQKDALGSTLPREATAQAQPTHPTTQPATPDRTPGPWPTNAFWRNATAVLVGLWAVGALLILSRTLLGQLWLLQLKRRSLPAPATLQALAAACRRQLGLRRPVGLVLSSSVPSALTWGGFRPTVALPLEAEDWPSDDARLVLLHEFEHVRRWDASWAAFTRVVLAFNWVNPLAWMAASRAAACREQACDETVLTLSGAPKRYAETLYQHAQRAALPFRAVAPTMAETQAKNLETRIEMILKHETKAASTTPAQINRATRTQSWSIALMTVATLTVTVAALGRNESRAQDQETTSPLPKGATTDADSRRVVSADATSSAEASKPAAENPFLPLQEALEKTIPQIDAEHLEIRTVEPDAPRAPEPGLFLNGKSVEPEPLRAYLDQHSPASVILHKGTQGLYRLDVNANREAAPTKPNPSAYIEQKLKRIMLPNVEFIDTPLPEALRFLRDLSRQLDTEEPDPSKRGVSFILSSSSHANITLKLTNVPLVEAIRYTTQLAEMEFRIEPHAVVVEAKGSGATSTTPSVQGRSSAASAGASARDTVDVDGIQTHAEARQTDARAAASLRDRASQVMVSVNFRDVTLKEALTFLSAMALEGDPVQRGFNIILDQPSLGEQSTLSLSLANVPLSSAVQYVAQLTGQEVRYTPHAIVLVKPEGQP